MLWWLSSAWKPQLRLGFEGLRLLKIQAWAMKTASGLLRPASAQAAAHGGTQGCVLPVVVGIGVCTSSRGCRCNSWFWCMCGGCYAGNHHCLARSQWRYALLVEKRTLFKKKTYLESINSYFHIWMFTVMCFSCWNPMVGQDRADVCRILFTRGGKVGCGIWVVVAVVVLQMSW